MSEGKGSRRSLRNLFGWLVDVTSPSLRPYIPREDIFDRVCRGFGTKRRVEVPTVHNLSTFREREGITVLPAQDLC